MPFRVIIPARYGSTRLPGKPLLKIAGTKKPMLQLVYERALQSGAESVAIATDDERIRAVAEEFGAIVCMTSRDHTSGTERLAEAVAKLRYEDDDIVVNVQGDEPFIPPIVIHQVANNLMQHDSVKVATLCEQIQKEEDLFNPNIVKVVFNRRGFALYFSRAPIPWERENFPLSPGDVLKNKHFRHIGIYAYRAGFLPEYVSWEACPLEGMESLEQLRVLWNGGRIHVGITKEAVPRSIDTREDLEKVSLLVEE